MIVHEVTVRFPVQMGGLTIDGEASVYLETQHAAHQFVKVAEERGWKASRIKSYVGGTLEQAIAEVEREIQFYDRLESAI